MKTQIQSSLISLALGLASQSYAAESAHKIDSGRSQVQWQGSKVVGGSHEGKVQIKEGSLTRDGSKIKSVAVTVDMTSITNQDLKDPSTNKKLVDHLRSADFFDVEKHPEAQLSLKPFELDKAGRFTAEGTLSIKGKSHPVLVKGSEQLSGDSRSFKSELSFDRTLYDVKYGSGKFFSDLGDKMISDQVKLEVEVFLAPPEKKSAKN